MQEKHKQPRLRLVDKTNFVPGGQVTLQVVDGTTSKLLDEVCALISHVSNSSMAFIARRHAGDRIMRIIGQTGTLVSEVDMPRIMAALDAKTTPILLSPNVRMDPRLLADPMLELMPHIRSLIAMIIPVGELAACTVLCLANPRKSAFQDANVMQSLSDLAPIIHDILLLRHNHTREVAALRQEAEGMSRGHERSFQSGEDETGIAKADARAAATFLFETLVRRRGLHSRRGADYVSLRTWRLPIKKYQISAMVAIKEGPSHGFVLRIADEIAAHVRQSHGEQVIRTVVPVPPGSSGRAESLSTMLAEAVAKLLGAQYENALEALQPAPIGRSTPRKSSQLAGYRLSRPVTGPVLIVDDVATSGRHLELAINACKSPTTAVYAVAWIGK